MGFFKKFAKKGKGLILISSTYLPFSHKKRPPGLSLSKLHLGYKVDGRDAAASDDDQESSHGKKSYQMRRLTNDFT